jgi:hypothetical protein
MGMFDIPGGKTRVPDDNEGAGPPAISELSNNVLTEIIKIDRGQIRSLQASNPEDEPHRTQAGWR